MSAALLFAGLTLSAVFGSEGKPGAAPSASALEEMRVRGILALDRSEWGLEEQILLGRIRRAEKEGASTWLRGRFGRFPYLVETSSGTWLTHQGYDRYLFLKSQEARRFFEKKGVAPKEVFDLRDARGELVFDPGGRLTPAGERLYHLGAAGRPVRFRRRDGTWVGVTPPPEADATAPVALTPKTTDSARQTAEAEMSDEEEKAALQKLAALKGMGFEEIEEPEYMHLLKVTKVSPADVEEFLGVQTIVTRKRKHYLLSESDPLMAVIARYRRGDRSETLHGSSFFGH